MKNKPLKNKSSTLPLLLLIGIFIFPIPSIALPQSIESAQDKYESGDFEGALEEVQAILEQDSKNLRAQSLMSEIERAMKKVEAQELTERALVEINSRRFEEAYGYLEQALILDPENSQARELYLSIHEVLQIEGESMEEMLERQQEELAVIEEEPVGEVPAEVEPIEVEPEEEEEPEPEPVEEKAPLVRRYDRVSIRGGFVFTFANSNNLERRSTEDGDRRHLSVQGRECHW